MAVLDLVCYAGQAEELQCFTQFAGRASMSAGPWTARTGGYRSLGDSPARKSTHSAAAAAPRAPPPANSIAVFPFGSRSPDTADVYIAEGMTEEVGNQLTKLPRLQVKARGVVAAQWQRSPEPLAVARTLGVAWFLHGNVRHTAGQLAINVELVRATSGEQVWSSRFLRRDTDLFLAQTEVAESVAVIVSGRLTPGEKAMLAKRPTRNDEAYRLYLFGNSLVGQRTEATVRQALAAYTEAVRLDPRFAAAWARIGFARSVQASWGTWNEGFRKDSTLSLARLAAQRARSLDSTSAEAWLASANVSYRSGDLWLARAGYERSLALDSLNAETWHWYGMMMYGWSGLGTLGVQSVGIPLFRRAVALDPTLRNTWRHLGVAAMTEGRFAEAEALLDTALALGSWSLAFVERAGVRFRRGNGLGAIADLDEATRLDSTPRPGSRALYRIALGDSGPARTQMARLRVLADSGRPSNTTQAMFAMALGLRDEALSVLERFGARRDPSEPRCAVNRTCSASLTTWRLILDPTFAPLRGDPRFEKLWTDTRPKIPWLPPDAVR